MTERLNRDGWKSARLATVTRCYGWDVDLAGQSCFFAAGAHDLADLGQRFGAQKGLLQPFGFWFDSACRLEHRIGVTPQVQDFHSWPRKNEPASQLLPAFARKSDIREQEMNAADVNGG
jgi:hypothetical protein